MKSLLSLFALGLIAASALGDIRPPELPKDQKRVDIANTVVLGKDVKGYRFYLLDGKGPGAPKYTISELKIGTEPVSIDARGRYHYVSVLALTEEQAKDLGSTDKVLEAYKGGKLAAPTMSFGGQTVVSDKYKEKECKYDYTITSIDTKKINFALNIDGKSPVEKGPRSAPKQESDELDDAPQAKNNSKLIIAGLSFTAFLIGTGLWLVRRNRSL